MTSESVLAQPRRWAASYVNAWDRFWFTPRRPNTLGILRILTGAMLLYGHLVLATELTSFLGDSAWVNNDTARQLHDGAYGISDMGRSYLWHIDSSAMLSAHHLFTILVTAAFMLGFLTRFTAPVSLAIAVDVHPPADRITFWPGSDCDVQRHVRDAGTVRECLQRGRVASEKVQ